MGIFSFVKPGKKVFEIIKPKIARNLDTKRAIQDKVVKTVDKAYKDADPQGVYTQTLASKKKKSETKIKEGKKLKDFSYTADKYTEKKAKGGRVGLRFGSKKKSNIQKIKETFGPGSSNPKKSAAKKKKSFPDLNKDGKVTFADILKGRGVKRG
jgi:hypothetical protein